jgi:hypothetical protein
MCWKLPRRASWDTAFASTVQRGVGALLVASEPSYNRWHEHIVALATSHKMPAMYANRIYVQLACRKGGGRASFWFDWPLREAHGRRLGRQSRMVRDCSVSDLVHTSSRLSGYIALKLGPAEGPRVYVELW